jgi:hypothetical protein
MHCIYQKLLEPVQKSRKQARRWWFMPVILATQEAEIPGSRFKASADK